MILEPADMHRALASHTGAPSPALIAVQELILAQDNLGIDPGEALDAARVLLAAHARELGARVQQRIEQDRADNPGGGQMSARNHTRRGGMMTARWVLDRYADDLNQHSASGEQAPATTPAARPNPLRQLVDGVAAQLHDEDPAGYHGDGGPGDCTRCAQAAGGAS